MKFPKLTGKEVRRLAEYLLYGAKVPLFLVWTFFQLAFAIFIYALLDLAFFFINKYFSDKEKDLSDSKQDELIRGQKALRDFEKEKVEQNEYYREQLETKVSALKLLNRLINEGLIRGKDLLSLAGTADYYQLFVYSVPASQLMRSINEEDRVYPPKRRYPVFLQELGFARLGQSSSFFLINKGTLKDKKLRNPKAFKKFLNYHFIKIQKEEWGEFIEMLKIKYPDLYKKYKNKTHKEARVLQINYLLTETTMNATNIIQVDNENIGLARVEDNERVNEQILKEMNLKRVNLEDEIKIRIKKVVEKLDISFLLDGVHSKSKNKVDAGQDQIKDHFGLQSVVGLFKVNENELVEQLKAITFSTKKAKEIAPLLIENARIYHEALEELGINL